MRSVMVFLLAFAAMHSVASPDETRFRLAVEEAKSRKLDAEPAVKQQIDKVLYRALIDRELAAARVTLDPTDKEVRAYYEERAPLVRLRQLVLPAGDKKRTEESLRIVKKVRERLAAGQDFRGLVLDYSADESAWMAGDLDFRGVDRLPPALYGPALGLRAGAIAGPIELGGSLHLVQLIDKKPYGEAPATYLALLRSRIREEREEKFLAAFFDRLARKEMP